MPNPATTDAEIRGDESALSEFQAVAKSGEGPQPNALDFEVFVPGGHQRDEYDTWHYENWGTKWRARDVAWMLECDPQDC